MALNLTEIAAYYRKMDDLKLEQIAKFEMASLRPEVVPIVRKEIQRRGLDQNLMAGIEAQTREISVAEAAEMVNKIKGLSCPVCGVANQGLRGGFIRKVRSVILMTHHEKRPMIACQNCLDQKRESALRKNVLLGWWGFPEGLLFRTPQAIIGHFTDKDKKDEISTAILTDFALQHIGEIKTNWDQEAKLVRFIHHWNTAAI